MTSQASLRPVGLYSSLILIASCLVGCGGNSVPTLAEVNNTNIKKLRGAYGLYQMNHNLFGPKSEEEFKAFLKTDDRAKVKLGRMGVSTEQVDDMFTSERDGQPFKVRYGLYGLSDHAIVFEAEGIDGKRFVSFAQPREVDATEYERLWTAKPTKKSGQAAEAEMTEAFNAN